MTTWTQPTLPGFEEFAPADLCGGASLCATCPSAAECHPSTSEDPDPVTEAERLAFDSAAIQPVLDRPLPAPRRFSPGQIVKVRRYGYLRHSGQWPVGLTGSVVDTAGGFVRVEFSGQARGRAEHRFMHFRPEELEAVK